MQLIYPGPFDQVDIPALGITAPRGVPVEIPDRYVPGFVAQGWEKAAPAAKPRKTKEL